MYPCEGVSIRHCVLGAAGVLAGADRGRDRPTDAEVRQIVRWHTGQAKRRGKILILVRRELIEVLTHEIDAKLIDGGGGQYPAIGYRPLLTVRDLFTAAFRLIETGRPRNRASVIIRQKINMAGAGYGI